MEKFISFVEAATLIPDGAVVTVSSSSGLGCPDLMLRAIGERFRESGHPRDLTTIHPIAAGDMYGIDGVDHISFPGLLTRIIAGSYPSGPSSMPSPRIWQMIDGNQVEAYNLPSGILFQLHAAIAAGQPGVLTQTGLGTFIDPRLQGGRMNDTTPAGVVKLVEFEGDEMLFVPALPIDVAIIRGTTADERGNISAEHEGALLGALEQAIAVRNCGGIVIGQVERRQTGQPLNTQQVRVPGNLVDFIVVDAGQMQTTQTQYDPAISGEAPLDLSNLPPVEWSADKIIARRAAMELRHGEVANLGFGISAIVPRILHEEGLDGAVTWVIEQGAVGGMPLLGFQFGCSANADAIMPSPQQFNYFQGGGFDQCLLSFMQVDGQGSVNVSRLAAKPHVTAGAGGFIDITARARRIIFSGYLTAGGLVLEIDGGKLRIVQEGRSRKFVPQLEQITFNGERAWEQRQQTIFITERCVIRREQHGLVVTEIAPGIDLERDVLARVDVPMAVSPDLKLMDARLFQPDNMNLTLEVKLIQRQPRRFAASAGDC